MLLVVFLLSRDVIGYEDSNWRDTTNFDSEDDYLVGCQNVSKPVSRNQSLLTTIFRHWSG